MNRKVVNLLNKSLTIFASSISIGLLLLLISVIVIKGIGSLSFDFILTPSQAFGSKGGILYQILGSLLLITMASILSFPISLGIAIFKSEYINSPFWTKFTDTIIYIFNGIPSILFGVFGLIFFVNFLNTGISWFVGSIILAIMIMPTMINTTYRSLLSVPQIYRESAMALGLNKWQVIQKALLKRGMNGAITGLFLGLARAIGETAPIMFIATAFSGVTVPSSLYDPVLSLPTHILALAQESNDPDALKNAWGASLILLFLVILFGTIGYIARRRLLNSIKL